MLCIFNVNIVLSQVKRTDAKLNAVKEKRAITQLSFLMQALDVALPRYTVKEYRTLLRKPDELHTFHVKGMKVMADVFGFSVEVGRSRLEGGGRGVLVTGGRVPLGHLVGIYPGRDCCVCGGVTITPPVHLTRFTILSSLALAV